MMNMRRMRKLRMRTMLRKKTEMMNMRRMEEEAGGISTMRKTVSWVKKVTRTRMMRTVRRRRGQRAG